MCNFEIFKEVLRVIGIFLIVVTSPIAIFFAIICYVVETILKCRKFKNIAGDVAVVTGAGHGLGRCIALELAKKGCHVAIVDINLKGAEETVALIKSKYEVECKAYKVDVASLDEVSNLNNQITQDLGIATILVNNAAVLMLSDYVKPKIEEIQRMINVNLTANFVTNGVFLENMKNEGRGHIVAVCAIAGLVPLCYNSVYGASKSGMHSLMKNLRLELKLHNFNDINTTTIFPSFLTTNSDVLDAMNDVELNKLFPIITGESLARRIVHAMQRNEVEVILPRKFTILYSLLQFFPVSFQDKLFIQITRLCFNTSEHIREKFGRVNKQNFA